MRRIALLVVVAFLEFVQFLAGTIEEWANRRLNKLWDMNERAYSWKAKK